jgi:hypothetical protein
MLAFWEEAGQGGGAMGERFFSVVAVTFFGEQEVCDLFYMAAYGWR